MRLITLSLAAALLLAGARAQASPQTQTSGEAGARWLDVTAHGARGDAALHANCSMRAGSRTLSCAGAEFNAATNGKTVVVAGAGASGATLVGTASGASAGTLNASVAASANVSGVYAVTGTENTAAFKRAIAAASASASGKDVFVPLGNYLFAESGGIGELPNGVTLRGARAQVVRDMGFRPGYTTHESRPLDGSNSTLVIASDEGRAAGRFVHVRSNAAVRDLTAVWPANLDANLPAPKVYPWFAELYGSSPLVENVQIFNPYQGIYSHIGEGHTVRNVVGDPLHTGLYASQLYETSRFQNISFHPILTHTSTPYGSVTPLHNYVQLNATAFKFGRVDNALVSDSFCYGLATCYKFVQDAAEVSPYAGGRGAAGGRAWVHLSNAGADGCVTCVDVEESASMANTGAGVTWTGGVVLSTPWLTGVSPAPANQYGVIVRQTNTGHVSFSNVVFHGLGNSVHFAGNGAGNVSVAASTFGANVLVSADFGGAGTLRLTGNLFLDTDLAVRVRDAVTGVGTGNLFMSEPGAAWDFALGRNTGFRFDPANNLCRGGPCSR